MNSIINWINSWTNNGALSILVFIPFAALLLYAAMKMVNYAEIIIRNTKLGGPFVGGAFIAAITSLPELITDITQSALGQIGAAAGSDIGSNAFSMFMIAIAGIIVFKNTFFSRFDKFTRITMLISAGLAFILAILMFFHTDLAIGKKGSLIIGIIPLAFFVFYLITLFIQYKWGTHNEAAPMVKEDPSGSVKIAALMFIVFALIIVALSLIVNWTASSMITGFGLPEDAVGGILLAITTSMPEIVAFFLLLKRHQPIAGALTLIGSHFFNLGIMFFGDLAYSQDAYFNNHEIGANWILALVTAVGMLILFLSAFFANKGFKKRWFNLAMSSLAAFTYILGWILQLWLV